MKLSVLSHSIVILYFFYSFAGLLAAPVQSYKQELAVRAPPKGTRSPSPGQSRNPPPGRSRSLPPGRSRSSPPGRSRSLPPGRSRSSPPSRSRSSSPPRSRSPSPGPKIAANAQQFIGWLGANSALYNKICFYSGRTGNTPIWKKMSSFESTFGCESIGSLLTKAGIKDTAGWTDAAEWTDTSKALATIARGRVVVILGKDYKPDGVWNTVELPTLKASQGVTSIERYIMSDETGKLDGPVRL